VIAVARSTRLDAAAAPVWAPCPHCWGQGRIYCRDEDRRLRPVACYGCLGVGQTLRDVPLPTGDGGPPGQVV
jgi:hypothetical protein